MGHPSEPASLGADQHDQHDHHDHHDHDEHHGLLGRLTHLFKPHSHDASDSVDTALESSAAGIRALKISLVALLVTAALQGVIVAVTGSVALLADTIHNFSDALTALPLWVAFILARRPASRRYTYGYGRAEDLAGIFIVAMIALSAVVAGWESVRRFADPQPVEHGWVLVAAGLIGFAGNELVAVYRIRVGHKIGSAALVADGLHARADGFTSLAVVVGALGVLAGYPVADPIIGLIITVAILFVLKGAARDIYHRLMDAIDPTVVDAIEGTLLSSQAVLSVDAVKARWSGHRIRAEVDIAVDPELSLGQAHAIATDAHHRLLHEVPKLAAVTVHVSPDGHVGAQQHELLAHHRGIDG